MKTFTMQDKLATADSHPNVDMGEARRASDVLAVHQVWHVYYALGALKERSKPAQFCKQVVLVYEK